MENKRILTITQEEYIEKILKKFNLEDSHPCRTPMVTRQVRKRAMKENEPLEVQSKIKVPYREAIGSLLYLANVSRPDITYAVNYLARR